MTCDECGKLLTGVAVFLFDWPLRGPATVIGIVHDTTQCRVIPANRLAFKRELEHLSIGEKK